MGAFAGQCRLDGLGVNPDWLRAVGALMVRRGRHELIQCSESFGIVVRFYDGGAALATHVSGDIVAVAGRLDNPRFDIGGSRHLHSHETVAATVAEALVQQGASVIGRLIGDFAIAHWNPREQVLLLGRDSAGVIAVYYHLAPSAVTFSTDLRALVTILGESTLDDDYVAGYLGMGPDERRTIYSDIAAVPAAHTITVSRTGRTSASRVWELVPNASLRRCDSDHDYEEQFRSLFLQAVRSRLCASTGAIAAELSGGLDSSSVVCAATHLLDTELTSGPRLHTISYMFDRSPATAEDGYISAVEHACRTTAMHVAESDVSYFRASSAPALACYMPSLINAIGERELAVAEYLRDVGANTLLVGHGGDEMFQSTNAPVPGLADLLWAGDVIAFHRHAVSWASALRQPYLALFRQSLEMGVLRPWVPPRWFQLTTRRIQSPPWYRRHVRAKIEAANCEFDTFLRRYQRPSQYDHAYGYYSIVKRLIAPGARYDFHGRNVTYPCLHRPLVEFLHTVPFSQKLRLRESRSLQRRALARLLPPAILARRGKAESSDAVIRGIREYYSEWSALLADVEDAAAVYFDVSRLRRELEDVRAGLMRHRLLPHRELALIAWLKWHYSRSAQDGVRVSTSAGRPRRPAYSLAEAVAPMSASH